MLLPSANKMSLVSCKVPLASCKVLLASCKVPLASGVACKLRCRSQKEVHKSPTFIIHLSAFLGPYRSATRDRERRTWALRLKGAHGPPTSIIVCNCTVLISYAQSFSRVPCTTSCKPFISQPGPAEDFQ